METHLNTSGKYVSDDRRLNKILCQLAQRGIEENIFSDQFTAEEISATILRVCRGTLFDWSLRNAPYNLIEVSKHDTMLILKSFSPPA